jgi:hypothetical protein
MHTPPPPRVSHLYPPSEIPKSCAESQAAWGSLAKYPGALAAPTRSPVSAPSTVPEPVSAGACSWRHVPRHLENEQVEREKKTLHLRAVADGVVFLGLSGSVPRGSRRAYAQSRQHTINSARTSWRRCLFPAPRAASSRKRTGRTRAKTSAPARCRRRRGVLGSLWLSTQ